MLGPLPVHQRCTALPEGPLPAVLPASWLSSACRCRVRNVYFEATPLELLAGVVTETGLLEPASIKQALEERRQQYATAFQL